MNLLMGLVGCRISEKKSDAVLVDLFDAATLGGARALGRDDIGRLAPGARADVAVFRLDDPRMTPSVDPITTLCSAAPARSPRPSLWMAGYPCWRGSLVGLTCRKPVPWRSQFEGLKVAKYPDRSWGIRPSRHCLRRSYPLWAAGKAINVGKSGKFVMLINFDDVVF